MKFAYKFNNLMGTVYRKGNVLFTPDGNSVISPVGNRITIYDLKNNKAKTLSFESDYNYNALDISPNGCIMVAANENGLVQMISMISTMVIDNYKFNSSVTCVKFSPNGKYFAVAHDNFVVLFTTPGELTGTFNSFAIQRRFICSNDEVTTIDWSYDSKIIIAGSKDNTTKVLGVEFFENFRRFVLPGHSEPIVGCYFEENSYNVNTISRNGQFCIWECSLTSDDLVVVPTDNFKDEIEPQIKKIRSIENENEIEDDIDLEKAIEKADNQRNKDLNEIAIDESLNGEGRDEQSKVINKETQRHPFYYKKLVRHYLGDEPRKENPRAYLTSATYHKKLKFLVAAFSTGAFYLYEIPDVNMIHSLSITDYSIDTASFNVSGDWIVLASSQLGQMLVWEWQSEQYIMKQQGHSSEMTCITYSPDGQYIATGGADSKVKLWNVGSGFCFVTFSEHSSCITAIQFNNKKKFVVSASVDGTVRAYDYIRYRNFRTFTTPQPVQFASVAVDVSGEFVAAGGQDVFEIFLWSTKLGRLLEVISGHEGPVVDIAFSPIITSTSLISGSWDKTIRIWNCLESSSDHETINVLSDVVAVAFKPDGEEVAVATINGNISLFNVKTAQQLGVIEGRNDLSSGRSEVDITTAKKNIEGKSFTTITYSADGECILAAGKSKNVCIYHVREKLLIKKFEITQNQSFDSLNEFISRRQITDFGNLALIEDREELEGGRTKIRLPGVLKGDMAARNFKPEVNVFSVKFSPTGQAWAAATTEGLLIYSLDKGIVFDPYHLSLEITPKSTRKSLRKKEYSSALLMALKLNEPVLVHEVIEGIPFKDIELVITQLPDEFAHRTLQFIIKLVNSTQHIEYYLKWSNLLLTNLGQKENLLSHQTLISLQQSFSKKYESLSKICDFNKYTLRVIKAKAAAELEKMKANGMDEDDDDDELLLVRRPEGSDEDDDENMSDSN